MLKDPPEELRPTLGLLAQCPQLLGGPALGELEQPENVIRLERRAQERHQDLLRLIERAKIELATGKRPPPETSRA